jgi:hypothetical protein
MTGESFEDREGLSPAMFNRRERDADNDYLSDEEIADLMVKVVHEVRTQSANVGLLRARADGITAERLSRLEDALDAAAEFADEFAGDL